MTTVERVRLAAVVFAALSSLNIIKIDWPMCDAYTSSDEHFNKLSIIHKRNIPLIHTFERSLHRVVVLPFSVHHFRVSIHLQVHAKALTK